MGAAHVLIKKLSSCQEEEADAGSEFDRLTINDSRSRCLTKGLSPPGNSNPVLAAQHRPPNGRTRPDPMHKPPAHSPAEVPWL